MKDLKRRSKYRRLAQIFTFLTAVVFLAVFYQPWRVHAFDLQQAVAAASTAKASSVGAARAIAGSQDQIVPVKVVTVKPDRWTDAEVVSALSSFYQTIITYMGLLLGLVGILAVLTLRFLSRAAAEDLAHESAKAAMQHYLDTRKFAEDVGNAVEETGIAKQLEQLAAELGIIRKLLKERHGQLDENEDADGVVEPGSSPHVGDH
jgi:beta-lactamase regulating signal transducer with metallopeptidase domain